MLKSKYVRKIQELKKENNSFQIALERFDRLPEGFEKSRQQAILYFIENEILNQAAAETKKGAIQIYKHGFFVAVAGITSYSVHLSVGMPQKVVGVVGEGVGAVVGGTLRSVSRVTEGVLNFGLWGAKVLGVSMTPFSFSKGVGLGYADFGKKFLDTLLQNAGADDLRLAICCIVFVCVLLVLLCSDWFMDNFAQFLHRTQSLTFYPGYIHYTKFHPETAVESPKIGRAHV